MTGHRKDGPAWWLRWIAHICGDDARARLYHQRMREFPKTSGRRRARQSNADDLEAHREAVLGPIVSQGMGGRLLYQTTEIQRLASEVQGIAERMAQRARFLERELEVRCREHRAAQ